MKGIILAGGTGSRLMPLTRVTNKHLLPVFNKPMIYYSLETLSFCGIKRVMIISGRGHAGHFLDLLGSGKEFGMDLSYDIQEEAGGIAQALSIAEEFAGDGKLAVVLGDNIFSKLEDLRKGVREFPSQKSGAKVFLHATTEAFRFGVADVRGDKIMGIEEKPKKPKSNLAVTGFYLYDNRVFDIIRQLKPSGRGELEITDVNNAYIKRKEMTYYTIGGEWTDAGTFDSLLKANMIAAGKAV
jgi:glucose-1-phosphate thymidylyltransferase